MSIQSEINRINAAKAAILAALTEKGVDTTGAGIADIAALVAGIQAGGGGGSVVYATGTFTVAATPSDRYTVTHGLGQVPDLVILVTAAVGNTNTNYIGISSIGSTFALVGGLYTFDTFAYKYPNTTHNRQAIADRSSISIDTRSANPAITLADSETFQINTIFKLVPDYACRWIAIGGLEL